MTEIKVERRKAQRVNANLNLEVKLAHPDGTQASTTLETINISSSGVYFKSGHFIAPMTKLALVLEVTVPSADGVGVDLAPVPCEGLIVRIRPETEVEGCDEYEVAVFFTHIEAGGAATLEKHIALLMEDPA